MKIRRRHLVLATTLLAGGLLAPASPAPLAGAAADNCVNRGNYFAGVFTTEQETIFGSRATIQRFNPELCSHVNGSPSDSSAWAMVEARAIGGGGARDWAQIGWAKVGENSSEPVSGIHMFAQWTRPCNPGCANGDNVVNVYGPDPGQARMYTNVLRSSDNHIHMLYDNTQLAETAYNPQGDWDPAWDAQYAGETFHPGSDVAGFVDNRASFYYLQTSNSSGTFSNITGFAGKTESRDWYHAGVYNADVGGLGLNIWTNPINR